MRLRGLALIATAMLLVVPSAAAGWAREPEIVDDRDPRMAPHLDIVRAWIEPDAAGIRFFVEAAGGAPSDTVAIFLFHVEATDAELAAAVGYGDDGVLRTHLLEGGLADLRGRFRPGFRELANDALLDPDRSGPVLSATIPWGAVDGLFEGAEIHGLTAGMASFTRGSGWQLADQASTDDIVVASIPSPLSRATAGILPILVPAWVLPLIVLGATAAGAGGGFALARRARGTAAVTVPVATSVPVRAPLPPPGQRFRAAPPHAAERPRPPPHLRPHPPSGTKDVDG